MGLGALLEGKIQQEYAKTPLRTFAVWTYDITFPLASKKGRGFLIHQKCIFSDTLREVGVAG